MKATKIIGRLIVGCVLACCLTSQLHSQTPPRLSIAQDSPVTARINWTNIVGKSYRLWFTESLAPVSWSPLEDAFSEDTNVVVSVSTTDTPTGFFRIQIPTNGTLPAVQIFSPTNSQTVSGIIAVGVGAQITNQLQGANLYLDDALIGFIDSGGIRFNLDTTHFANGSHTLYAGAVDTANNESLSSPITLDFENPVRWLDACSMFNSFVPIDVDSDIYPADWLVTVTDTNGVIVRTITGSTTDGIIQTSWDGTDDNAQPLPVENLYQITVDVTETSGSSMMMSSSLAGDSEEKAVSFAENLQGVPEFAVQEPAPNPLTAYEKMLEAYTNLTPQEKLIYPPLPPRPADNPDATTTVKMSARDMFFAMHKSSGMASSTMSGMASPNADSSMRSGSTKDLVWWEIAKGSGKIVISRVPIPGNPGLTVGQNCNSIATFIGTAEDAVGHNRSVYGGFVQVVSGSGDVTVMTNRLTDTSVTAFYFYGHGNTNGNVIGTTTAGVSAKDLGAMFGNKFVSSLPASSPFAGKPFLSTHNPYFFVFLDGCNTALGNLPEAFGIPKYVAGASLNEAGLHMRAFLGWTGPVTFQFDTSHIDWSLQFWTAWMDEGNSDVTVADAIRAAYQHDPSVLNNVPIRWYGNGSLQWSTP